MKGKKIIVAVCGSIAAYKAVMLVRLLIKEGAEVKVIMTPSAQTFVGKLTFSTLSKNPVYSDVSNEAEWNNHVELGLWADLMIIAPATANTLARMASGICDNMLLATYLSSRCPIWIAPAMDLDMWKHASTLRSLATLRSDGVRLIDVGVGELASGLEGAGRMAEPHEILTKIATFFKKKSDLEGCVFLVTAGPTYEDLDPVRYLGNRSSGKMGIALALSLQERGAEVHLVIGPTTIEIPTLERLTVTPIRSAEDMSQACQKIWPDCKGAILAAAVADYRPAQFSTEKIKKKAGDLAIELERTTDIAATLGLQKSGDQISIGFALETQNGIGNAQAKLEKKSFDMIVLNSPNDPGGGFQHDTNKVTLIHRSGTITELPLMQKTEVADKIVEEVVRMCLK